MASVIDPVCGMQLDDQQTAITSQYMNRPYFFCSLGCKQQFDNDPQRFAVEPAQTATPNDQALAGQGLMGARPLDRSSSSRSDAGADSNGQWNTEQGVSGSGMSGEGMTGSGSSYDRRQAAPSRRRRDVARRSGRWMSAARVPS